MRTVPGRTVSGRPDRGSLLSTWGRQEREGPPVRCSLEINPARKERQSASAGDGSAAFATAAAAVGEEEEEDAHPMPSASS